MTKEIQASGGSPGRRVLGTLAFLSALEGRRIRIHTSYWRDALCVALSLHDVDGDIRGIIANETDSRGDKMKRYCKVKWLNAYLSTVCAHCTSNKNQHALMVFNGNRFRHTASSVQVRENDYWMHTFFFVVLLCLLGAFRFCFAVNLTLVFRNTSDYWYTVEYENVENTISNIQILGLH